MRYWILLIFGMMQANETCAQQVADSLFTWEGYLTPGTCSVELMHGADTNRPWVVLIKELAINQGPTVVEDLGFIAEQIGRTFSFDPVKAFWIIRWGAYSYSEETDSKEKELLLRATFSRTTTGRLSSPQWRILTYGELKKIQGD